MLIELLRSWQLSHKKREEKLTGGKGGLYWPGPPQLPVHRSQWKFIFPIGHINFRIRLDSMLKLIRNYINPIGVAVRTGKRFLALDFFPLHEWFIEKNFSLNYYQKPLKAFVYVLRGRVSQTVNKQNYFPNFTLIFRRFFTKEHACYKALQF